MTTFRTISLFAATLTMGLAAGLFYVYSYSIMPGLARTDDRTFVSAMNRLNEAITNGWFAISFGGAVLFTALATALHFGSGQRSVLPWLVAALVLYLAVLVITFAVNIPLNDELLRGDHAADLAAVRERFEGTWVRWNVVRSIGSVGAFGCLLWALVQHGRTT